MSDTSRKYTFMIVAGEASGDLHGSALVREMKKLNPHISFIGIGGDNMEKEGVDLLYHINEMGVLGFGDVIKRFPFLQRVFHHIVAVMKDMRPDLIILIDYPGMNFKFAKAAQRLSVPVFYYIAPQVWAWGTGRLKKMSSLIDKMAVILPFEQDLFTSAGIDAQFVGHPLIESFGTNVSKTEFYRTNNLASGDTIIGLLPGSRVTEVKRLLPIMLQTAHELNRRHDHLKFFVARSAGINEEIYTKQANDLPNLKFVIGQTYEIMHYANFLIVKSGTSTLESALAQTPFIIVYKVDPFSYYIGKILVKIKNIGLVNVIAGKPIVPEFIQNDCTVARMLPTIETLLFNDAERNKMTAELVQIKSMLGTRGASTRAAELALATLKK